MPALRTFSVRPKKNSTWAWIKTTINPLKSQAKKQTIRRRWLKGQLKALDAKIAQLTAELGHLCKISEPEKVFKHCYPHFAIPSSHAFGEQ